MTPHPAPRAPQFLPLALLTIPPDGQRETFDPTSLTELARSIKDRGLLSAIITKSDGRTVVAGRRRLKAIREYLPLLGNKYTYMGESVPAGFIPVYTLTTDDPLEVAEIEWAENNAREDLTWQEKAKATAMLKRLREAQALGAVERGVPVVQMPSVASIALEIRGTAEGAAHTATRNELIVAEHMHDPEVAKAPTLKDAMKVLLKKDAAKRMTALALAVGKTHTSAEHRVLNVNCLDWMSDSANHGQFDVILTDPPYGMGADGFGDAGGKMANIEHHYDDSYENWLVLMGVWCAFSYLVAKPEAHCYVWCDIDRFHELRHMMQVAGWKVHRTPLTNYKKNSGRVPWPDQGPRRQSEWCLYAVKGNRKTNMIASDVIVTESDEQLSHGAQKPVALYDDLLRRSVRPGDAVLDSFGGTGTLIPAAHALMCKATVLEQNPEYYGICLSRLNGLDSQKELPV